MATDAEVEAAWSVIQACGQPAGAGDGSTYIPRPPTKDDVRRALGAAEKAAWMPISEAPRDGTEVLLCDSRTNIQVFALWDGPQAPDSARIFGWKTLDGMGYMTLTFTHFRPIPTPPTQ